MIECAPSGRALELQGKIRAGLGRLEAGFRGRHGPFVVSAQEGHGGFAGREGAADLYYTHFGLRGADVLEIDHGHELWSAAANFMGGIDRLPRDAVDCYCEAFSRVLLAEARNRPGGVQRGAGRASELEAVCWRELPGGGATSGGAEGAGSLYRAFLAAMTLELLGERPPAEDVNRFVLERRCKDGGFGDTCEAERGSLNPTAAAVVLLASVGKTGEAAGAGEFLAGLQRPDGGYAAHRDAPRADLMSTFTALVALDELDRLDRVQMGATARFARELEAPDGGFYGVPGDCEVDVEYTYYGLGVIGLLSYRARVTGSSAE